MSDSSKAVFLSYAREDADAARRIAEALRAAGIEVWFDETELGGGDAWDQKIRRQIKECGLFMPVISARTNARREGYFRREWKLAVERTHDMDEALPFLVPVVVDGTTETTAFVPEKFREVQWTRLAAGESSDAFCKRVAQLLTDQTDTVSESPAPKQLPPSPTPATAVIAKRMALGAIAAGVILIAFWWTSRHAAPANATRPPATVSEAQKLLSQARTVMDEGDDLNHENVFLVEDLLKRALALDGTDARIWGALAENSSAMMVLGYDRSVARREALQKQAERAVALAPDTIDSQLAYSMYLERMGGSAAEEAASRLKALSERAPKDGRIFHALGLALARAGKQDEAVAALDRANALPGGDPRALVRKATQLIWYGRYEEAEAAVTASLAQRVLGRAQVLDVLLKLSWRGDLESAAAAVERWPAWLKLEPRGAFTASQVWLWRGEPDKAIAILQAVPSDAWNDTYFAGPKAALLAFAHEKAGRAQAARAEWENARRVATRMVTEDPSLKRALALKGVALARLGETAEAETILREVEQTGELRSEFWSCAAPSALLRIALGHGADVSIKFDSEPRTDNVRTVAPSPQAALRLNPMFEPIRSTQEFQRWMAGAPAPKPSVTTAAPNDKSVAVLAFDNLSGEKDNEYFSDGISEELLNVLAKVPGLRVAAHTSSFYFKGKQVPMAEIAKQLNVSYVIEGSVRKVGTQVRITAQLISANDGFHVWSDTFTRELKDIFALQDEIAGVIAQNLQLKLGTAHGQKTVNPEAHRLALEGRSYWTQRTEEGFARAEATLTKALALDPSFAEAHSTLAQILITRANFRLNDALEGVDQDIARGTAEARRASELDTSLAEPHAALGFASLLKRDLATAHKELQTALSLDPNSAVAHLQLQGLHVFEGRLDLALVECAKATEADPLWFTGLKVYAEQLYYAERVAEANRVQDRAAALRTDIWVPLHGGRARVLQALGRRQEALAAAHLVTQTSTTLRWMADGQAIDVLRNLRLEEEALAHGAEMLRILPANSYARGVVLIALGRFDEAAPFLEHTPPTQIGYIYWDPILDPYRGSPRFQELVAKLGLTAEYKVARETLAKLKAEDSGRRADK